MVLLVSFYYYLFFFVFEINNFKGNCTFSPELWLGKIIRFDL